MADRDVSLEIALALVRDDRGRWLVGRRADDVHLGGLWEFPGGKLEAGESVDDAVVREVKEETGLTVKPIRRLEPVMHVYPDRRVRLHAVVCEWVSGRAAAVSSAVTELRWVETEDLVTLDMPEANRAIIVQLAAL